MFLKKTQKTMYEPVNFNAKSVGSNLKKSLTWLYLEEDFKTQYIICVFPLKDVFVTSRVGVFTFL